ncbi:MAG: hypothetical protein ACREIT_06740, partial [Tepidisphaeraceae bacterium]
AGHQAELHHPGVWVKNVLIHHAAARLGGAAYHLAVDTDEPKHLNLRWPSANEPLTDDSALATAAWVGMVGAPTPLHLMKLQEKLRDAASKWSFEPCAFDVLRSMRRLLLESPRLPQWLVNSEHEFEWSLGLRHHALVVSPLWTCEPYAVFVYHVLARACAFAADYNVCLADYRREHTIRSPGRPMPDLRVTTESCEMPFWLDDLSTGTRTRARVGRRPGSFCVLTTSDDRDEFALDPRADGWDAASALLAFLRRHDLRLSPRAITLTTFARLALADQFVHGIGGGRYDQVTDRLIARFFKLQPPHFSVTTATLYFPDAVGRSRACLPCVAQDGHRLRHGLLGDRKRELLREINASPRNSPRRRQVFSDMHRQLSVAALASPALKRWEQRLAEAESDARQDELLFDRELFFALQPRDRLEALIARYAAMFQ